MPRHGNLIGADVEYIAVNNGVARAASEIVSMGGRIGHDLSGFPLEIRPAPQPTTPEGIKALVNSQRRLLIRFIRERGYAVCAGGYPFNHSCGLHIHLDNPSNKDDMNAWIRKIKLLVGAANLLFENNHDSLRRSRGGYGQLNNWRYSDFGAVEYRAPHSPPHPAAAEALYALATIATKCYTNELTLPRPRISFTNMTKRQLAEYLAKCILRITPLFREYEENLKMFFGAIRDHLTGNNHKDWWGNGVRLTNPLMTELTHRYWGLPQPTTPQPRRQRNRYYDIRGSAGDDNVPQICEYFSNNNIKTKVQVWIYGLANENNRPPVAVYISPNLSCSITQAELTAISPLLVLTTAPYGTVARRYGVSFGIRRDLREPSRLGEIYDLILQVLQTTDLLKPQRRQRRRQQTRRQLPPIPEPAAPSFSPIDLQTLLEVIRKTIGRPPTPTRRMQRAVIIQPTAIQRLQQTTSINDNLREVASPNTIGYRINKWVQPDINDPRNAGALQRARELNVVSTQNRGIYVVNGHHVVHSVQGYYCDCMAFRYMTGPSGSPLGCKHILAVMLNEAAVAATT